MDSSLLALGSGSSPFLRVYNTADLSVAFEATSFFEDVYWCCFSYDNKYLAVSGKGSNVSLALYDTSDWSKIAYSIGGTRGLAFSRDGKYLAVATYAAPYLKIYDIDGGWTEIPGVPALASRPQGGLDFSVDGSMLVVAQSLTQQVLNTSNMGNVTIFDPWDVAPAVSVTSSDDVQCVRFSDDGNYLGFFNYLYSVGGLTLTQVHADATGDVLSVDFSKSSSYIGYGRRIGARTLVRTVPGMVNLGLFSPTISGSCCLGYNDSDESDSTAIAAGSTFSQARIYDPQGLTQVGNNFATDMGSIHCAGYNYVSGTPPVAPKLNSLFLGQDF